MALRLIANPDDPRLLDFFSERGQRFNEPTQCLWLEFDGKVLGGWIFTGYNGDTIQVHVSGRGALTRRVLKAMFSYSFDQLAVKVIIAAIPGANSRSLEIGRKLGFRALATIEEIDLHLLTMNRSQCRWLE